MGSMHNCDRPQGQQNLLEALANFKRRNQWILLNASDERMYSPRMFFRRRIRALHWATRWAVVSSSSWQRGQMESWYRPI